MHTSRPSGTHEIRVAGDKRFAGIHAFLCCLLFGFTGALFAQTAATGALKGTVTDPSGSVVPGVTMKVTSDETGQTRTAITQSNGTYLVPLLPLGEYRLETSAKGFKTVTFQNIPIHVTETALLDIHLQVGAITETVTVNDVPELVQTNSSALGSVTDQRMVETLPLVTRNYTQILGLSPGVSGEVNNSASIGRGDSSQAASTGGYSTGGNATNDNNFQMNGSEVNDLMGSGSTSGGIPVPNPDSIQEFKVQTGQYDASYGRNAGANVDVVTKSGTNAFHGDVWEYFRNTALNANNFFLKQEHQPRGVLNQNQFGGTLGGPIKKDKVFFFGSYQGTREKDGLDVTGGCLSGGSLPIGLTNNASDRTAAALASTFGVPMIDPTALAVLNAQLPNGQFVIPAPQSGGTASFSSPCPYTENQFVTNGDFYHTDKSHFSGKFLFLDRNQKSAFPGNNVGISAVTVPGFPQTISNGFRDFSLTHTYAFNDRLLNQAILGYHRTTGILDQAYPTTSFANSAGCAGTGPITLASLCVPAPDFDNVVPQILVQGAFNLGGNGQGVSLFQNSYNFHDSVTYVRGKHSLHVGGGIDRAQINEPTFHFLAALAYLSFNDFLTGNPLISLDVPGLFGREWRAWNGDLYVQDDYKVLPSLTLNLGFRYERQGQLGEMLGRASTFNIAAANPVPSMQGTLQGYVVASNFHGTLPTGPDGSIPTRASTNTALNNIGQNGWEPRVGFAWQLPGTTRMVLRGGYGIYYTRTTGQPFFQLIASPPYGMLREFFFPGIPNAFPAVPALPFFPPYSPTTSLTPTIFPANFRPPIIQQYST